MDVLMGKKQPQSMEGDVNWGDSPCKNSTKSPASLCSRAPIIGMHWGTPSSSMNTMCRILDSQTIVAMVSFAYRDKNLGKVTDLTLLYFAHFF